MAVRAENGGNQLPFSRQERACWWNRRIRRILILTGLAAGCSDPPDTARAAESAIVVSRETEDSVEHLVRLKAVIRQDALTSYGAECGTIEVPEDAFIPVEMTGGGLAEVAVTFGRVRCGIGLTRFSGTGGVMVQFWIGSGGPVRLVLEQQMHGFTPAGRRLITMQHGGFCPGGAGPDQCRVTYEWNDQDRRLDVVERRLASDLGQSDIMTFDWPDLNWRR
ncbi:MAG TPA: hypothetical protein VFZ73_17045 [Gemmatimonadaceae bacterium]